MPNLNQIIPWIIYNACGYIALHIKSKDELSFTVDFLRFELNVFGRVSTHDYPADNVHGQPEEKVDYQAVPE